MSGMGWWSGSVKLNNYKNKTPQYSIRQVSGAGFFSAIPMTLINAPFERVKIMFQLQGQKELKPGEKPKYNQRWSECGESAVQGGRYPICLPRLQSAEGRPTIEGIISGVYRRGGIKAFFPGFGPALARAVPANAATFLGVELAHKFPNKTFGS
jgi:Mitochondrial carrier protein